jgi:UDP-4-amino-4,6-dideoxy-N-acetyl-beta-L-altrosamine transaminase
MTRPPLQPLPYGRQCIEEDDIAAVVECLRGDWLTQGPRIEQFEQLLCTATGARYAVAVSSGTAALHLAALAAGVAPGDSGITSAITFVASANCIAYCGGQPAFADVDPETGLIDLPSLQTRVDELTRLGRPPRVIVPVDFAGQSADLPAVQVIARRCGARVIEDAAHSLGASYIHEGHTYRAGSCAHSDLAVLSFHPVKHITTGEGGAVLTNDEGLAERLRTLRTHGIHRDRRRLTRPDEGPWYYEQDELGYNYRITDLQCALGIAQANKLARFVERRNVLARLYDEAFSTSPLARWLKPLKRLPQTRMHSHHLYVVKLLRQPGEELHALAGRRRKLYLALRDHGIYAQVHYIPVPWQPYYQQHSSSQPSEMPGAAAYYSACLSLPLFPRMADGDVGRVVEALLACGPGHERGNGEC